MDILSEKRILVDALDCKIAQLKELQEKLIQEHNAEAARIQQEAHRVQQQAEAARTQPEVLPVTALKQPAKKSN